MLATVLTALLAAAMPENAVFEELSTQVKLPAVTMPDGLDAAAQHERIKQIAGPNRRVKDLTRKSIVAPFVLKIGKRAAGPDEPPVRTVDVWFVAHGSIERFFDETFLEDLAGTVNAGKNDRLPVSKGPIDAEELKRRGLAVEDSENRKERFVYSTFGLFDRVLVSATRRVMVTRGDESVLVATMIDPRFTDDPTHPNRWQKVTWDQQRQPTLGPPQPYVSGGFYTKVTKLADPPGALFIEHHHQFAEPTEWFDGKNLLRSKLPLVVQDAVRKLRRKLR